MTIESKQTGVNSNTRTRDINVVSRFELAHFGSVLIRRIILYTIFTLQSGYNIVPRPKIDK